MVKTNSVDDVNIITDYEVRNTDDDSNEEYDNICKGGE